MCYYISYMQDMFWTLNSAKTTIDRSFAIVAKEGIFWLSIVTSRQLLCKSSIRNH